MTAKMTFDRKNSSFPGPDYNPILNAMWPDHFRVPSEPVPVSRFAKQLIVSDVICLPASKHKVSHIKRDCFKRTVTLKFADGAAPMVLDYNRKILVLA